MRAHRALFRFGAAIVLALAGSSAVVAQVPLASTDLRLPSDGTGTPSGTLAVRLTYPADPADYRYQDGAPVAIYLPGGFAAGGLGAGQRIAQQGFVVVTFIYPGGSVGGSSSDGVYDFRGENCVRAVRDIIRFSEGAAVDSLGRSIEEIVPGPVHEEIVGLAPYSNGLIGLVAMGLYGAAIPIAPFHAGWENPTSGQIVTGDLGTIGADCDGSVDSDGNGMPGDDGKNPWYDPAAGYGASSFAVDFSALAFDPNFRWTITDPNGRCAPVAVTGIVLHDGRRNGRLDFRPGAVGCTDYDGDGLFETSEDFRVGGIATFSPACSPKIYYSLEVARALQDRRAFPGAWPSWIATPAETDAFWDLRDAMRHWDSIAARFPDFRGVSVFTKQDHVQAQDDHPHLRQMLDGMAGRQMWHRLQADAVYYIAANGSLPAGYVENPANTPVPSGGMKSLGEPRGTPNQDMGAAAAAEMADRIHSGCWWLDLSATLGPAGPVDAEVKDLAIGADGETLTWTGAANAFCYDLLRGDAAALAESDGVVSLSGAVCLEEDSRDTAASDPAAPPPGSAWYYVVKPNGAHGTYGAASDGGRRTDAGRACLY